MAGQFARSCHPRCPSQKWIGRWFCQQQKASDMLWMAFWRQRPSEDRYSVVSLAFRRSAAAIRLEQLGYHNRKKGLNIVIHWRCGHEQEYQSIPKPSAEMQIKIIRAKDAIASQSPGLSVPLLPTQFNHRL